MRSILAIPYSNADEGRVFAIATENKTCFWSNLDPEETLASIAIVKLAMGAEEVEMLNLQHFGIRLNILLLLKH